MKRQTVNRMPIPESSKRCPYCRERIPAAATRCRYCRESLLGDGEEEAEPVELPSTAIREKSPPPARRPARRVDEEYDEDDDYEARRPRRRSRAEEDYEEEERPQRRRRRPGPGPYADCPDCGCPGHADRIGFTWWGGLFGPWLFTHVRCRNCDTCYNGKTGNYNTVAIGIYLGIGCLIGLIALAAFLISAVGK